jgi:predicted nucleotidyltransferase
MGTIPKSILEIVDDYVKKISKQIPVKKALLFGSFATGSYTKDSDVDVAIFSDYFSAMDKMDAFRFLFLQAMDYDIDLQPQSFTVEDYENPVGIVEEIIKKGIEIPVH